MAGPNPVWTIPDPTVNSKFADLNALRDDLWPTFVGSALVAGALVPGWDLAAETHDASNRPLTQDFVNQDSPPKKFRVTYTYTGSAVSTVRFQWDRGGGAGYENWTHDLATVTTGANGIVTSVTWQQSP